MGGSELPSIPAPSATLAEQQASLRRVAALVAAGAASADVFAAIAREVAHVLAPRLVQIFRWEADGTVTVVGTWGDGPNPFPAGSNWPWEDASLVALMERMRAGELIRIEDVAGSLAGALADAGLGAGVGSAAGAPIVVAGETWGHMSIEMTKGTPLPSGVEEQLAEITALVATAIASSATREQLTRLAEEQAALRRVATLVASGAPSAEVLDTVAGELGRLLGVGSTGLVRFEDTDSATVVAGWGRLSEVVPIGTRLPVGGSNVITQIARTGRPARLDDYARSGSGPVADRAHRLATRSSVGSPIVVAGRLWGAMIAAALEGGPLPHDTEPRLGQFTELVGTAIANTEARLELARLADEQAALRRVATLVAEEGPVGALFAQVAQELEAVLGVRIDSAIVRYEDDDAVAVWGQRPPGGIDCPILVQGRVWGALVVAGHEAAPLPAGAQPRIAQFTELVATAIANAQARAELRRLVDEQAALRRVATLVARAAAPAEVFDAVIAEVARLLEAAQVGLMRAEGVNEVTIVAHRGQDPALVRTGMRLALDGESVTARVLRSGRSARLNRYEEGAGAIAGIARRSNVAATVGAPVTVEGRLWGVITASWDGHDRSPADAEERLTQFAGLLDTAIANADSRDQLNASRARVLTAGDEARRRVVRDLHDGAQQRLVHTIVTLKLAQRALGEDAEQAESLVAEALEHAERGNAELRDLAHGILPSVLTRGGLHAGIDSLVSRLGLPVDVDVPDTRLAPAIEASAYFVVAEALTNVLKHARAARAQVTAVLGDGTLSVEVRDDGVGGADPDGHGLLGVSDRVAALGGQLRIDSPRGGGTVVAATLPV